MYVLEFFLCDSSCIVCSRNVYYARQIQLIYEIRNTLHAWWWHRVITLCSSSSRICNRVKLSEIVWNMEGRFLNLFGSKSGLRKKVVVWITIHENELRSTVGRLSVLWTFLSSRSKYFFSDHFPIRRDSKIGLPFCIQFQKVWPPWPDCKFAMTLSIVITRPEEAWKTDPYNSRKFDVHENSFTSNFFSSGYRIF